MVNPRKLGQFCRGFTCNLWLLTYAVLFTIKLPTGENEFCVKELDANIVFEIDADESARGFVVRFAAGEARAKRIR